MHSAIVAQIPADQVRRQLGDEISRLKTLSAGAAASGVRVHTTPTKPREIEDDGHFHYAVLEPTAVSESGKPNSEARRFLDETTGPEKPRVFRNAVLLLAPSKDGLSVAEVAVRDQIAWERVLAQLTAKNEDEKKQKSSVDPTRLSTLKINIDKAKAKVPEAIRKAYCIVITVSDKDEVQAFKITVSDQPHFETIKQDKRSRVQDTAITAEALLPDGPYNLWKGGETNRRVKDLAGAFAQLPHLPKMLKSQAIVETLVEGCVQGTFVLKLARPDRTFRTWWRTRPDAAALSDPALELVLPAAAELAELPAELLAPKSLPDLWPAATISVQDVTNYFNGSKVVLIDRGGFSEPVPVPKASQEVIEVAVGAAVAEGRTWLTSGPASLLAEPIPTGVLSSSAKLHRPPAAIVPAAILPEALPAAWKGNTTTALAIATALSQQAGQTLPWKSVRDVINSAIFARFIRTAEDSAPWPCEIPAANNVKLQLPEPSGKSGRDKEDDDDTLRPEPTLARKASAILEASHFQDLSD
ncbi:MAG: hypothetical protein ACKO3P_18940, partial [Planctomycetaceae bacterium]